MLAEADRDAVRLGYARLLETVGTNMAERVNVLARIPQEGWCALSALSFGLVTVVNDCEWDWFGTFWQ